MCVCDRWWLVMDGGRRARYVMASSGDGGSISKGQIFCAHFQWFAKVRYTKVRCTKIHYY